MTLPPATLFVRCVFERACATPAASLAAFDAEADDEHVRSLQDSFEQAEESAKQARALATEAAQRAERLALSALLKPHCYLLR